MGDGCREEPAGQAPRPDNPAGQGLSPRGRPADSPSCWRHDGMREDGCAGMDSLGLIRTRHPHDYQRPCLFRVQGAANSSRQAVTSGGHGESPLGLLKALGAAEK